MKLSQSQLGERLNIILFPCNQFGNQEPGTIEEIQNFIQNKYPGNYLLFNKIDVVGENADPIFDFLAGTVLLTYHFKSLYGLLGEWTEWDLKEGLVVTKVDQVELTVVMLLRM